MAVTYLLEVQASISKRDIGIIKLNTSAGEPPCALTLLQRFAAIGNRSELAEVLREGRNWCATVRQSHSTHPSLIYFQSVATGAGWPAALGAMLDLALLCELCIDDQSLRGPAVLLREEGARMARELARGRSACAPKPRRAHETELEAGRRAAAGSRLPAPRRPRFFDHGRLTRAISSCVKVLADHLGKPAASPRRASS